MCEISIIAERKFCEPLPFCKVMVLELSFTYTLSDNIVLF